MGAAYLIWLGLKVTLSKNDQERKESVRKRSRSADFVAGFLTTLSNPKAILFYVSFFPAFLDLSNVGYLDLALLLLVATVSVGGIMALYAFLTEKVGVMLRGSPTSGFLKYTAGGVLVGSGVYIATRY